MDARKRRAVALQIQRALGNFARARVLKREFLLPFVGVYHINYRCNGRCSFCSRTEDIGHGDNGHQDITQVRRVLQRLRELTPSLYITGGEPTLESNIGGVLKFARYLDFFPVCINTNAIILDEHPLVPRYADKLVVSLHAGTPERHGQILGVGTKLGERVFDNIVQASRIAKASGNTLSVNCVLTGDNTRDAYGVLDFCQKHEIPIAVVPAIEGHMPTVASRDAETLRHYREFITKVIEFKVGQPRAVVGTRLYLEHIRRLGGFICRPSGIITISPEGDIVSPCSYKYSTVPHRLGTVNGTQTIESQLRRHLDYASAYETCGGNCLKMCYLEPALLLEKPWLTVGEFLS